MVQGLCEKQGVEVLARDDRLEELVGVGRRMPFSTRVMVEEEDFLGLLDQIRAAVPREIRLRRSPTRNPYGTAAMASSAAK